MLKDDYPNERIDDDQSGLGPDKRTREEFPERHPVKPYIDSRRPCGEKQQVIATGKDELVFRVLFEHLAAFRVPPSGGPRKISREAA
jgi:hypothetical protein